MAQPNPTQTVTNPRIGKLIELEVSGRIKPEHQQELDTYRAQGLAPKKAGGPVTESERTAAFLATRLVGAMNDISSVPGGATSKPELDAAAAGTVFGQTGRNLFNSEQRQRVEAAQLDALDSALTLGTGAAYTKEQLEGYRQSYFPQIGDDDATVEDKRGRLLRLIEAARVKAGSAAPQIDDAISRYQKEFGTKPNALGVKQNAVDAAIDEAAGMNSLPKVSVNIGGGTQAAQTPEFRAGLEQLLNEGAPKEKILEYWDKNAPGQIQRGADPMAADPMATERGKDGIVENADALVRGVADTAMLGFADELSAAGDTIFGDGTMAENLRKQRAVDRYDESVNPYMRAGGQILGAVAPVGVGRIGMGAKSATDYAKAGGALGAGYGFGSGDTLDDRVAGAASGGVTGAALGYGVGKLANRYLNRGPGGGTPPPGGPVTPEDASSIAARLGIDPTPAVVGGRFSGGLQMGLGNAPGSLGVIREGVERETEQLGNAARRVSDKLGGASTPQKAGEDIAAGAGKWREQTKAAGNALYKNRDDLIGGPESPVVMGNTGKLFQQFSTEFPSSPVLGAMMEHPAVRKMATAMPENGELTLGEATEALSHIRAVVRNSEKSNTMTGAVKARVQKLEQAIEDDVMNAASASDAIAGRKGGAVTAQKTADAFWADRAGAMRGELKVPLESSEDSVRVPGEKVFRSLFGDMRRESGNLDRLQATWSRLPGQAKNSFSATAFDALGRAKDSAQNAMNDAWSFETFLTNWSKTSDEAKQIVFGGRGVGSEINDIVRYASRLRDIDKARNFSNTGKAVAQGGFVSALASTFVATAATAGPSAATGATAVVGSIYPVLNASARLFMQTPAMRSWLRSALRATVKGANGSKGAEANLQTLVRRLPTIAARNPQIANEVRQFEQALLGAANDNAYKAAASGPDEEQ